MVERCFHSTVHLLGFGIFYTVRLRSIAEGFIILRSGGEQSPSRINTTMQYEWKGIRSSAGGCFTSPLYLHLWCETFSKPYASLAWKSHCVSSFLFSFGPLFFFFNVKGTVVSVANIEKTNEGVRVIWVRKSWKGLKQRWCDTSLSKNTELPKLRLHNLENCRVSGIVDYENSLILLSYEF